MKVAVVGATGLVGGEMLKVLAERHFPVTELFPVASARSVGQEIEYQGKKYPVVSMEAALAARPDVAIFSAGGSVSKEQAPRFAEVGTVVIDNSSAWRMDPTKKLVVPEINANDLTPQDKIIANPNCSTIQMVLALHRLHAAFQIKRIVVSTYQSVTGTGKKAVDQLMAERAGQTAANPAYPHRIDLNVLPHIDVFEPNGYTKEEMKMVNETKKILGDDTIQVTATAVRIPVLGGHSEAINVEFAREFELEEVYRLLRETDGVVVVDDVAQNRYPMPQEAHGQDAVLVGRIRRDESQPRTLNLWVVADNLRKGAATNAVQIAEYMVRLGLLPGA
ncbi:aspartate-semialdehyde dehydrogenase [Hymenobacter daecheongensis DSM 21074]|uniref:Aspartate-semialdehyde dehydrogenase n=1 Tax=Hymenobacter daecheongensis DSM 21074 TaxID=1121955 RepID=A0A1M6LIK5_9BACT|nr:aspartate-semialdehyde dehydrogenase [Hymenobacter daecheongensis]SHJ70965.1 aspartate-semialdehyde dehydrogenase [Hymenobacter daecheongensis DSM 21074]